MRYIKWPDFTSQYIIIYLFPTHFSPLFIYPSWIVIIIIWLTNKCNRPWKFYAGHYIDFGSQTRGHKELHDKLKLIPSDLWFMIREAPLNNDAVAIVRIINFIFHIIIMMIFCQ